MQLINNQIIPINPIDAAEATFCKDLWLAVVHQVILDLDLLVSQALTQSQKLGFVGIEKHIEVLEIMEEIQNPYFEEVCQHADIDVSHIRRAVEGRLFEANWNQQIFGTPIEFSLKTGKCLKMS